jgi:hypothetical protein
LPSLSFTRDHRGYEYTAVVHAGRRKGAADERILYWFRTPPGIKFGRVPIDEDVIRSLEESNPDLLFDWAKILQPPPAPPKFGFEPRSRARKVRRDGDPAQSPLAVQPAPAPPAPAPALAEVTERAVEPLAAQLPGKRRKRRGKGGRGEALAASGSAVTVPEQRTLFQVGADTTGPDAAEAAAQASLGSSRDGNATRPDFDDDESDVQVEQAEDGVRSMVTPAGAALGPEALARLRTRCAELMARITERIADAERADQLRDQAQRLNPDAWVTSDDVRAGLECYEQVYQELRQALGPDPSARRRGKRRGRGGHRDTGPSEHAGARPGTGQPPEGGAGGDAS